ncbi:MAG: 50S ribosomal protein L9 [Deltaproteobacteria bacterium]|nr:50S ribosomal protein L9 [Deltaproteobacteria bacterium]MBI2341346.1 50S ribosomal protein L9 [Deltaproteobacteria bacterium]MBI2975308.1 50S ribosomal protein L9 [Deltaproteobacteria bacterium]
MEVILREVVAGLGKAGELVKVKDGFARNFLLPQKKAVVADSKNIKMIEHQKKTAEVREKKLRKSSEDLASKLSGTSVTISRDCGAEEKIFGSVTARDIAESLKKNGITVDKRNIILKEPIKQIGVFDVEVKLHPEVTGTVKVWVVKK